MKSVNVNEMRKVNGGGLVGIVAFLYGAYAGIDMIIQKEHRKYGHCVTYAWACSKCR